MKIPSSLRVAFMSLLLVTAVVGGAFNTQPVSPVGEAEAAPSVGQVACASSGLWVFVLPQCTVQYGDINTTGQTVEESHLDLYANAATIEDKRNQQVNESESHANQTVGLANAEGKYAVIKALNNNKSVSQAKSAGIAAVNEFYADQQESLIVSENRQVLQVKNMKSSINSTEGLSQGEVFDFSVGYSRLDGLNFGNSSVTLVDGEVVNVTTMSVSYYDGYSRTDSVTAYGANSGSTISIQITDPLSSKQSAALDEGQYAKAHDRLETNRKNALNNVQVVAEDIYANYNPGETSVQESKSPSEVVRTSSTNYGSTGGYGYVVATASEMGYATNATSAFVIEYTPAGSDTSEELSGTLFAQDDVFANDTINTGQVYNSSELGGNVFFANQLDSKTETIKLDGQFEILSMTDVTTGDEVNSTTIQSTQFTTTGTENLTTQVDDIITTRGTIGTITDPPGGGGVFGDGRLIGNDVLVLGGLVVAMLLLASRIQDN